MIHHIQTFPIGNLHIATEVDPNQVMIILATIADVGHTTRHSARETVGKDTGTLASHDEDERRRWKESKEGNESKMNKATNKK
jgi:hypothetical protein